MLISLLLSCNPSGDNTDTGELVCTEDDLFTTEQCPDTYPDLECTVFVDGEAESSGDGWSWDSPVKTVQEGVDLAHCGAVIAGICTEWEVWVKEGTYYIHKGCREHTVRLREQVALLGGFDGTETEAYQRDWEASVTTLNGRDAPGSDNRAYHVVIGSDEATIDGFTITGGNADDESDSSFNAWGGGMFNHYASPEVLNCIFEDNYAGFGGGVTIVSNSGAGTNRISDCIFRNNEAGQGGGAIDIWGTTATVIDCEILENTSFEIGGAVIIANSEVYMERSEIHDNFTWVGGGGIAIQDSSLELRECALHDNSAQKPGSGRGGGIDSLGSTIVSHDCDFVGNEAAHGGAIFSWAFSFLEIGNSVFTDNAALGGRGGAIFSRETTAQVTDVQFKYNDAAWSGGGVHTFNSTTTWDRILLEGNTAEWGGGIHNLASEMTISNSVVASNSAVYAGTEYTDEEEGVGGGIHSAGSTTSVVNCTLHGNTATLGGDGTYSTAFDDLYGTIDYGYYEDITTIVNSILWNNGAEEIGVGDSTLAVSYSNVTGGFVGDGNIDLDSLFVDAASGDFHLQAGSPCIGAANPKVAPELDMDGNPRDGEPDMGAYEY